MGICQRTVSLLLIAGLVCMVAPVAALADDTVAVQPDGSILFTGDDNANQIHFTEGAINPDLPSSDPSASYAASFYEMAPGESIDPGNGCRSEPDPFGQAGVTAVLCGSGSSPASITINGNGGDDTITAGGSEWAGTSSDDPFSALTISGGDGNDTITALDAYEAPNATVNIYGDAGDDTLVAETVQDPRDPTVLLDGGDGNDTITGGFGTETLDGDAGTDTIKGLNTTPSLSLSANTTIDGGADNDVITVGSSYIASATGGPGQDTIIAGSGTDTINTYDGEADTVTCMASANDNVTADQFDQINTANCAKVTINQYPTSGSACPSGETGTPPNCTTPPATCPAGETGTPPNCTTPPATCPAGETGTPPNCTSGTTGTTGTAGTTGTSGATGTATVSLAVPKHQTPVRSKGIATVVSCSAACTAFASASVKIGSTKPFVVVSKLTQLSTAGSANVTITFSHKQLKALKYALKHGKRIVATIEAGTANPSTGKVIGFTNGQAIRIKS